MKKSIFLFGCFILIWGNVFSQGYWTAKANVINGDRCNAASFSVGTKGYICCGVTTVHTKDLLEYDPSTNTWTQKADFPGIVRRNAISFTINNKAYVGLGSDGGPSYTYYYDFYEYDPATNTWTQKASFPGPGRAYAHHFTVSGKAYVGGGTNGTNLNDLWEYNPVADTWTQKNNPPYPARNGALAFALKEKGYVGTGQIAGPTNTNDFWEYNPGTDTWTQRANLPGGVRNHALGFAITEHGYVISGYNLGAFMNDFWEYNILTDTWTQLQNLTGVPRSDATGFGLGEKVYIGTGWDGNTSTSYLNDFWEYTPAASSGVEEQRNEMDFNIIQNPANDFIRISFNKPVGSKIDAKVYNSIGEKVYESMNYNVQELLKINISNWNDGVYFIGITINNKTSTQKFVKIN